MVWGFDAVNHTALLMVSLSVHWMPSLALWQDSLEFTRVIFWSGRAACADCSPDEQRNLQLVCASHCSPPQAQGLVGLFIRVWQCTFMMELNDAISFSSEPKNQGLCVAFAFRLSKCPILSKFTAFFTETIRTTRTDLHLVFCWKMCTKYDPESIT